MFQYVKLKDGYYYNNHKSHNGDKYHQRRYLVGTRGNQKDHIKITTDFDKDWLQTVQPVTPKISDTLSEDSIIKQSLNSKVEEEDTMKYFEKL